MVDGIVDCGWNWKGRSEYGGEKQCDRNDFDDTLVQ